MSRLWNGHHIILGLTLIFLSISMMKLDEMKQQRSTTGSNETFEGKKGAEEKHHLLQSLPVKGFRLKYFKTCHFGPQEYFELRAIKKKPTQEKVCLLPD